MMPRRGLRGCGMRVWLGGMRLRALGSAGCAHVGAHARRCVRSVRGGFCIDPVCAAWGVRCRCPKLRLCVRGQAMHAMAQATHMSHYTRGCAGAVC